LARNITKKLDVNNCSLTHFALMLLLHYQEKGRSCNLAVHNNEFILSSTCIDSEMIRPN